MSSYLEELIAYVGFGESDRDHLRTLHPVLAPCFPEFAERFYEAVWAAPGAAAVLSGPEQVERLRRTLIDWMSTGLLGPHDERFYDKRARIGRRHVAIGLPHHYMFGAMNVLRTAYRDRILTLYPPAEASAMTRAVDKLLDIELAIMSHHYQLDSEERRVAHERSSLADRLIAMQTMSAGFAHEARNPLNAAQLQLELLERRLRRDGQEARFLEPTELAHKEMERLTLLLNDFLAFARPPELAVGEHDVAALVRGAVDGERTLAERRGVAIEIELDVERAGAEPLIASVDGPKLHQIAGHLVRNAIEAVPEGGHVWVAVVPGDERFVLRVADDGPGIPEEVRVRIYEPFFSTKESGTGLGMSIVHTLVSLHGGTIDFDTGPRGTRFDVVIPRRH